MDRRVRLASNVLRDDLLSKSSTPSTAAAAALLVVVDVDGDDGGMP